MTQSAEIAAILETIYTALNNNNDGIDGHIATLKKTLAGAGQKTVVVDPARLVKNNRDGRKLLQAYFRQRGVTVEFSK